MSDKMYPYVKASALRAWVQRLQLFLSALALLICLYSVSSVHQHDAGYHVAQSDCISCDIEDLLGHGAVASTVSIQTPSFLSIPYTATLQPCSHIEASFTYAARAPPSHT